MIKFGVIGYGYWGPNVVRNLSAIDGSEVVLVCDKSPDARRASQKAHPGIPVTADAAGLLSSAEIDAIGLHHPDLIPREHPAPLVVGLRRPEMS